MIAIILFQLQDGWATKAMYSLYAFYLVSCVGFSFLPEESAFYRPLDYVLCDAEQG